MEEKSFTIYLVSGYPKRSHLLIRALKSALNQNYSNYNIVVRLGYELPEINELVDEKVIISYFDHESIGVGNKLGRNLAVCKEFFQDYVCFLDDDDYFTPDKLNRINTEFKDGIIYVHNGSIAEDENGKRINYYNGRDDFNMSSISVSSSIIEKDFFYDLDSSVDTGIYLCAIKYGELKFIDDKLTHYMIHKSTTMGKSGEFEEWRKKKLDSYKNIIQPTYEYMLEYFVGTKAEKYAKRMLDVNSVFLDIYEKDTSTKRIGIFKRLSLAAVKPYVRYRDKFAVKVIIASIFARERVLRKLYSNDMELSNKI